MAQLIRCDVCDEIKESSVEDELVFIKNGTGVIIETLKIVKTDQCSDFDVCHECFIDTFEMEFKRSLPKRSNSMLALKLAREEIDKCNCSCHDIGKRDCQRLKQKP